MTEVNQKRDHYKFYLKKREAHVNAMLNRVLFFSCLAGPAIALGIYLGFFTLVSYETSIQVLFMLLGLAIIHSLLLWKRPGCTFTKYLGLAGTLFALVEMCLNHLGVYLTFFFVPLMSLFYCSRRVYSIASAFTYLAMVWCNWEIAPYVAASRIDDTPMSWFLGNIGGETIEFAVMFFAGLFINKLMMEHLRIMYDSEITINKNKMAMFVDALTGVWNRAYLNMAFDKFFIVQRNKGALLVLGLDFFKSVNDRFGHNEGDKALKLLADVLRRSFAFSDALTISRFEGDQFVVLLPDVQNSKELSASIEGLLKNVHEEFAKEENLKDLTLSVGAAFIEKTDEECRDVLARADKALYLVKRNGRNSYWIYSQGG